MDLIQEVLIVKRGWTEAHLRAYAKPNMTPSIRNAKNTFSAEWTMTPIQVLRKRQVGNT